MLGAFLAAAPAHAGLPEAAGVIHADKPYGAGTYVAMFTTVYAAELWTDAVPWSAAAPFALTLRYRMNFTTAQIVARSKSEIRHVHPGVTAADLARYGAAMEKLFPAVHAGDALTAVFEPGKPVRVFHNGMLTGEIDDAGFARDFAAIWLSPRTSAPGLRRKLLRLK